MLTDEQKLLLDELVHTKLNYDDAVRDSYGLSPGIYSVVTPGGSTYHVQIYAFNPPDVRGPVVKP
jgi:hypothetical protein